VSPPVNPAVFVRQFLSQFLETRFVNGLISEKDYYSLLSALKKDKSLEAISRRLFDKSPDPVSVEGFGHLRIVYLREPDGSTFPFLQGLAKASPVKKPLSCFVGHRFLKNIENSLRFNLRHLFEPYKIDLFWSGYDLSSRNIFEEIVKGIKDADLCFFDNLGTLNRPNVYVEIGMAHVLAKPMLVSEYLGPASRKGRKMPDTGSVPSDLQGLLRIPYRSYEDLCLQLYFNLPIFLKRHGFR
jgi:hypothetical protein